MKKIWWKKGLALGLALSTALGAAGCGKGGNKTENAALAKEHVYKFQEFELPEMGGDDFSVRGSYYRDGMIYLMTEVYHWSEGGDDLDMKMITMKDDGSDVKMVDLEIPEWRTRSTSGDAAPAVPEEETEAGSEEGSGEDTGETEPEEGAEGEEDAGEGGEEDAIADDMLVGGDVYENSYYGSFSFGSNGMIYAVRNYYFEDYSSEEYASVQKNYISCWNTDGSFAWEKELEGLNSEEEYAYIAAMSVAEDGTLTLILSGDKGYKMTVDAQGNVSGKKPLPEDVYKVFNNYNSLLNREDGSFLILYYDENDWQKQFISTYDPATDQLGEASELPASMSWDGYNTMAAGVASDLIFSNSRGVFTYNKGAENTVEKMNFINSDLNISNFTSLVELDENTFIGVFSENYEETKAGLFTYVDPKDIPDKAVLVLAGNYVGSDMKQRVVEYNRTSEEYRITLKEYDTYNSYDDYEAGMTQLNNDITSGNMPDILITNGLPVENYVSKGLLADIGKRIEADEELANVEFVQNVLDAYTYDGKLCFIIPYFNVSTVIGKQSILGDRTSWTMADMKQLMETLPEGTNMFGEMTRDSFMYTMMDYCAADFVDTSSGKCNFDSQNFIDMLEYAKTLPEELSEDSFGEDYWMNYESQYREDRTILRNLYISDMKNINYSINGSFGEEVSYIGFPTESGMGAYVQASECYAISARSANIDGAWDFLRYYLTDEYQSTLEWGLPIQKKYFMESSKKATERPYYTDENGEKVEYDDYYYMNGEEIKLDPMTQEQVDKVVNYILSLNNAYYGNQDIAKIISEEAASFFEGQKSAQEVARVIQSRAQIYVDERR